MLQRMRRAFKNKKGFTLIELIVVIAIIGILAAIAVPSFSGMQKRSKEKADVASATTIGKAAEAYFAENNTAPTGIAELKTKDYLKDEHKPQLKPHTAFYLQVVDTNNGTFNVRYDSSTGTILYSSNSAAAAAPADPPAAD